MYGQLRKEDTDCKKLPTSSTSVTTTSWQKPSPTSTSGDDATKGENTHNCHDGGTGTNSNRYARKKSGLKPIRPTSISASNLNPITPGKLPQTPRLNFKENELSRFGTHDFPSTPKFGRSESTPELHRIKKLDHLLKTADKSMQEKTHGNILQENSVSNLLTLTSDSLPDIFRKPIIQQQPDVALNLQSKFANPEDNVSKWGYGPSSSTNASFVGGMKTPLRQSQSYKEVSSRVHNEGSLKPVKEETPSAPSIGVSSQTHLLGMKNEYSIGNRLEKSSVSNGRFPIKQLESEESISTLSKSLNKSGLNSTTDTIALGGSTQPTVKVHPLDQPQTPLAKKLSWTGHSPISVNKVQEPALIASNLALMPNEVYVASSILTTKPADPVLNVNPPSIPKLPQANKQIVNLPEVQSSTPNQGHLELQRQVSATIDGIKPPLNSRPPPKSKQITVNGKLYTVMKPLGRGGSSVVYQVLNQEMTDIFALKVVRLDSVDEITAEGYINEVRLLKQLQGLPRVVRLLEYEYNEEEEKLLLVMEKGDTDFATVIRNRTSINAINPTLIRFYWQEMLEAVGEIHKKNVIHTDLKPANFLLVNGGLKLIDFGIATSIQADMTSIMKDSQCGTYNYMAPEAIKSASPVGANQEYKISRKTDVWSLGCMLYSLIYKNPPFNKFRDTIEKISAIIDERHVIDFPSTADPMVIAVLKGCLDRNPRNRPSIEELLSHPYLMSTHSSPTQSITNIPEQLRTQLRLFLQDGKLTEDAKEIIRQWV